MNIKTLNMLSISDTKCNKNTRIKIKKDKSLKSENKEYKKDKNNSKSRNNNKIIKNKINKKNNGSESMNMHKMEYVGKVCLIRDMEKPTVVEDEFGWYGVSDEVMKLAETNNQARLHEIAEARMNAEPGNERDDHRFLDMMKAKEDNKSYIEDVKHHDKAMQRGLAIVEDIAEQWKSHLEQFHPVWPSYANPDWRDIIELNEISIKVDNDTGEKKYIKIQPQYQKENEDKHITSELLIRTGHGNHYWIKAMAWNLKEIDAKWVYTNKGRRMVIPVWYSNKFKCFIPDKIRTVTTKMIHNWVKHYYPNVKINAIYNAKISGWSFKDIDDKHYYTKEDKMNPFLVDMYNDYKRLHKLVKIDEYSNDQIQEIAIEASQQIEQINIEHAKYVCS